MQTYSLTSAEVAVLVDHMAGGRLLSEPTALSDLRVDEQALTVAEEDLLDRGLLLSLPFEEDSGVTSELATVLSTALSPDRVCIVRTVHKDHTDPLIIFSFTPEAITRNAVTSEGEHVFTELANQEEVLTAILSDGGALTALHDLDGSEPRPVQDLLIDAERLVTLMVVTDPAEAKAVAGSIAWVETGDGWWLVDGAADGETPLALPVDAPGLRQQIGAALEGES